MSRRSSVIVVAVIIVAGFFLYRYFKTSTVPEPAPSAAPAPIPSTAPTPSVADDGVYKPGAPLPVKRNVYDESAEPKKQIKDALVLAQATHRRVLIDFGANWCPDCQVLDIYFHHTPNSELLNKYYVLVHVDVGRQDKNLDVAHAFNVPIDKGIPALAVVAPTGQVVYSQTTGQFNNVRALEMASVTEFLNKWKPEGR